ncbi:LysR family transcriptional regulator [Actinomadura napierensis]|uniref:LysR substrate-binding domain-containing protein n=1 Tax=Actinomadura napierensis TaxID=267854 RepID=A0ABP5JIG2_9ACTN
MELGGFDLNLLVVLDTLLREQNVTRAAERLHLSQPAVSTALARLRKSLDDPLLVKQGRVLVPTPRAEALAGPVREVLATVEQSVLRPPGFDPSADARTFSLVASDYVGIMLIRPLLARLGAQASRLRVDLRPPSFGYLTDLQRDEIDVAVIPDRLVGPGDLPDCSSTTVIEDRFVGVVWREHPLAAAGRLTAAGLADWPYLAWAPGERKSLVEEDLDDQGITRNVEAGASSFVAMPFMVTGTPLITIIPERLALRVAEAAELVVLPLESPLRPLRQLAYWHARRDGDPGHVWLREQLFAVAQVHVPGDE